MEKIIIEMEKYIKSLWRSLPIPIAHINSSGMILEANELFNKIFGKDTIGMSVKKIKILNEIHNEILKNKEIKKEITINEKQYSARGKLVNGEYFLSFIDITERKKFEEKLKDFLEVSSDFIWEVDSKGRYTFISGRVKEILGYSPEELIGKTPFELMPKDEAKKIKKIFKQLVKHKKPIIDLENWNITKKGEKVCLLTNGIPLFKDGKLVGYRGVDKDITKEKLFKTQILVEKNKLKTILQSIGDGLFVVDKNGYIVFFNKIAEKITGIKEKDAIGKRYSSILKFITKKGKPCNFIEKALKTKRQQHMCKSTRLKTKKGIIYVDDSASPIKLENELIGVVVIFRDITKEKLIEQELIFNKNKYKSVFNNPFFGIIIANHEGRFIEANKKALEILMVKKDEIIGKHFVSFSKNLVSMRDIRKVIVLIKNFLLKRKPIRYQQKICKDGKEKYIDVRISIFKIENKYYAVIVLDDITKLIISQQMIKRSEERYRDLFENATELIQSVSSDMKFIEVNNAWLEKLKYNKKDLKRLVLTDILDESCKDDCIKMFYEVMKGKKLNMIRAVFKAKDGTKVYTIGSARPIIKDGKIIGTWGIFTDITKEIKLEKIRKEKEKAEIIQKLRSEFFMRVSHELRHPLVPIVGYAQVMLDENPSDIQRKYLEKIIKNAKQLRELIDSIIEVSALQSGEASLVFSRVNLKKLIEDIIKKHEVEIELKGLKLVKKLKIAPKIKADKARLYAAIDNIFENAITYTEKGKITVILDETNTHYKIVIADTGKGMTEEEIRALTQGSLSFDIGIKKYTHLKLGFLMSKLIIDAHKGELIVKSKINKGSEITILLPKSIRKS